MVPIIVGVILISSIIVIKDNLLLQFIRPVPSQPRNISVLPTTTNILTITPLPTSKTTTIPTKVFLSPTPTQSTTSNNKPIYYPVVTNTPVPTATSVDTTAPVIEWMTGPADGTTVDFDSFCFPMKVTDNVSQLPNLWVRFTFDSPQWGGWTANFAPCYQNVANGTHTFSVQAKDGSGNVSATITRRFTVNTHLYAVPPTSPTPTIGSANTPTPTNSP